MNLKLTVAAATMLLLVSACNNHEKEDVTSDVNKAGSVETAVTVNHLDSAYDVIVTTHKVWRNFNEFKTIEYRDTIPALGETTTEAENADGDTKNVKVKKDYEIFITVK
jgi:ABC-type polysaccharide transport system permease subunit